MANFRSTSDIVDRVLRKIGETTNGTSPYETDALETLNEVHQTIISGGTLFDQEVDEPWTWARSQHPMTLTLEPAYETGNINIGNGLETITFSSAPTNSLQGWHLKVDGHSEWYVIKKHVGGQTEAKLSHKYLGSSSSAASYKAVKLDYELVPEYIYVDNTNNKIDFEITDGTETTATIANGSYTPNDLASAVDTALAAADGASSYSISYDSDTKKFTLASDRAGGGGVFELLGASGSNASNSALPLLGFDVVDYADAASRTSIYPLGAISRMIEPFRVDRGAYGRNEIVSVDAKTLLTNFPLSYVNEGTPTRFAKIKENQDGIYTVRFDRYPSEQIKMEIDYIEYPKDLKDNAVSRPLFPRKYVPILEDAAAALLLHDKEDSKKDEYFTRAKAGLIAMRKNNRAEIFRAGKHYGQLLPREDYQAYEDLRKFRFGYTKDDY